MKRSAFYKGIFILLGVLPAAGLHAQCKDMNPKEQHLYESVINLFDTQVKDKCTAAGWMATLKFDGNTNSVTEGRPMPERPVSYCGMERLTLNLFLSADNPRSAVINDSIRIYEELNNTLRGKLMNELSKAGTSAEIEAIQKKQKADMARADLYQSRWGTLSASLAIQIRGDINAPLLSISEPSGGTLASNVKKLSLPGVQAAYLLTLPQDNFGDKYALVIGLGKWPELPRSYDLGTDVFINYHFAHRYPNDLIESLSFTLTGGSREDILQLAKSIDWGKFNSLLTN